MSCKFVELAVGITSHINEVHGRGGKNFEVVGVISPHDLGHKECISVLTVPSLGIRLLYAVKYQHLRKNIQYIQVWDTIRGFLIYKKLTYM